MLRRRQRNAFLSTFSLGLCMAGLPAMAFVAAHYFWAPPAPEGTALSHSEQLISFTQSVLPSASRWSQPLIDAADMTKGSIQPVSTPAVTSRTEVVAVSRAPEIRASTTGAGKADLQKLTLNIQTELKRVGCFSGDPDGSWSDGTRRAMAAFNESVKVQFPLAAPDYILLTLLQGHNSKACTRACNVENVRSGECIGREQAHQQQAQQQVRPRPKVNAKTEGWTASVEAAKPSSAPSMAKAPVRAFDSSAEIPVSQVVVAPIQILPGRMAVGAAATGVASPAPVIAPRVIATPLVSEAAPAATAPKQAALTPSAPVEEQSARAKERPAVKERPARSVGREPTREQRAPRYTEARPSYQPQRAREAVFLNLSRNSP